MQRPRKTIFSDSANANSLRTICLIKIYFKQKSRAGYDVEE